MFENLRIKEHTEIAGSDGEHVGTVDEAVGETIKLTKTDSADHQHHTLPFDMVNASSRAPRARRDAASGPA